VRSFGYFFPGVRAMGERIVYRPEDLAGGLDVVDFLVRLVASGSFLATDEAGDCDFCDWAEICGDTAAAAAKTRALLESSSHEGVEMLRRLRQAGPADATAGGEDEVAVEPRPAEEAAPPKAGRGRKAGRPGRQAKKKGKGDAGKG
jgi:hypothetical protein